MVRVLFHITCLVVISLVCTEAAHAQGKLKKMVFENCDGAKADVVSLAPAALTEFCSYLSRVLEMQTGISGELMPEGPMPPQAGPGAPLDAMRGESLWHIFEPTREKEAKRCALALFDATGGACSHTIPDILPLLDRPFVSSEIGVDLEQSIWNMTLAAKQSATAPDPKWFSSLIAQLGDERSGYLAGNILIELRERSVPHLLSALASSDSRKRSLAQSTLLRLDDQGDILGGPMLMLLGSADEGLRLAAVKLLARLPNVCPRSVPRLIERLSDPSPSVQAAIYEALSKMLESTSMEQVARTDEQSTTLMRAFENGPSEHRTVLEEAIKKLVPMSPENLKRLRDLLASEEADIRARTLRILAPILPAEPSLLSSYFDALYDPVLSIRLNAVRILSSDPSKAEEKASALLKALKSNTADKNTSGRNDFITAVAKAVRSLPVTQSSQRMIPYFVDALAHQPLGPELTEQPSRQSMFERPPSDSEAARTLIYLGKEAVPATLKALRDSSPLVRRRALYVVSQVQPVERQTAKLLVFMLKDPDRDVRLEAERVVASLGADLVPEVTKGLKWPEADSQLAAAKVLLALGIRDDEVERVFRDGFSRADCPQKLSLVKPLVALKDEYREKVQPFLVDCALTDASTQLGAFDALLELTPLQDVVVAKLTAAMKEKKFPRPAQLQFLERSVRLNIPAADVVDVLREMLKAEDNSIRSRVIELLPELGEAAKNAVSDLKRITEEKYEETILRAKAAFAIAKLAPDSMDWQKFFINELEGEGAQYAAAAVAALPPDKAVPFLKRALTEVQGERKATVLSIIGKYGPNAMDLKSDLLSLLKSPEPLVRYQATLALLRVDPQEAELLTAFRRELVGRFGREMEKEKLGSSATGMLNQILSAPQSFVEQRAAEALRDSMR